MATPNFLIVVTLLTIVGTTLIVQKFDAAKKTKHVYVHSQRTNGAKSTKYAPAPSPILAPAKETEHSPISTPSHDDDKNFTSYIWEKCTKHMTQKCGHVIVEKIIYGKGAASVSKQCCKKLVKMGLNNSWKNDSVNTGSNFNIDIHSFLQVSWNHVPKPREAFEMLAARKSFHQI
ncbi:Prolamin-like domain [Forsythia ovata]|uniref:Prolamin-like domain n=1 Tax=Forsythia ovata TaxID=205694 RepID=A0ABD1S040_9LAMI